MKGLIRSGIILIIIFLMTAHYASAQEGNIASINVYPVSKTLVLSKGEIERGTFKVQNVTDREQHIYIKPRPWNMIEENMSIPLEAWLRIVPEEFDIGPGEEKTITYDVMVPEDAQGELAVMIAFRPKPEEGRSINVVFSVSLYVRVKDVEKIDCNVTGFELWKYDDRKAYGTKVLFTNSGNTHMKPRINVYIQNLMGKNLGRAQLKYGRPVYPGKSQDYDGAIYNFLLKPGMYKAMIDADFENVIPRLRRNIYFIVGKEGRILMTFFKGETG
jgi:hypothetical protein